MSDNNKEKELEELETEKVDGEIKYEENDNWEFEATAHTLENTLVDDDEFEITLPEEISKREEAPAESADEPEEAPIKEEPKKSSAKYETRERPKAVESDKDDKESKSSSKAKTKGRKNTSKFICGALVALIIAIVLGVFGWRYYTQPNYEEKMNYGNVALTVGDEKVSIGMYNYYYNSIYNNYVQYAQQGYYQLDTTKDYTKQKTTNAKGKQVTWAQMFEDDTVDRLQYILAFYQAGTEKGVTLTKEQQESIDSNLDDLKKSASDSDMSVNEYISETYGEYCGLATIKKMLTQAYIANNYYRQYMIDNRATEKEINDYYKEHKDDYTQMKIGYIPIPYNADDATARAAAEKNAKKYAKGVKTIEDLKLAVPKACKDLIKQYVSAGYFEDEESCAEALAGQLEIDLIKSDTSFPKEGIEWAFSDKTKKGTATTITDTDNAVVFILLKLSDPKVSDDETYSVRHILITPESDEKDEDSKDEHEEKTPKYTKKAWTAAKKKADKILAEYNKGDKTELEFAKLAEEYSDDTESTSNGQSGNYGGLYEGVSLGQMVPNFEEWSTDKSRKYGDTGIVKSDYGYHIMYFIEDAPYYIHECAEAVVNKKGDEFIDSAEVKKSKSVMAKTTVAKPEEASDSSDAQTAADAQN